MTRLLESIDPQIKPEKTEPGIKQRKNVCNETESISQSIIINLDSLLHVLSEEMLHKFTN